MTIGDTSHKSRYDLYNDQHRESLRPTWRKNSAERRERERIARAEASEEKFRTLKFVAWDGEGSEVPDGEPQPYMLFGNTDGLSIQAEELRTLDCLDLICKGDPGVINFGFAFNYDVNQILWELPRRKLYALTHGRRIIWSNYIIDWAPHKWIQVRRNVRGSKWVKIYDVFHFFNEALVKVLDKYEIGTEKEREYLRKMKEARPQFSWAEIEEVKKYFDLEGKLMVKLMEYMRDIFADAGMFLKSWHGAGAAARHMLLAHKVKAAQVDMRKAKPDVWIAARYAFSAGRFHPFVAGYYHGDVFNYDIHSAFPYAIQFLPNLADGEWSYTINPDRNSIDRRKFALYQINYHHKSKGWVDRRAPRPLFRRLKNDNICWPDRVNGWYWSPEAELVKDDPDAQIKECWEFIPNNPDDRPMAWIAEVYRIREHHKSLGHVIEYPFKLGMNATYGQFAQRAGWQNVRNPDGSRGGPPTYHQLEWAGYVTSMCKAMVYRVAKWVYSHGTLISIDTDAVFSTVRIPESVLPNGLGPDLGQWDETKYDSILVFQTGFYWLTRNGELKKAKSRGAPRGTVPIGKAWCALDQLEMDMAAGIENGIARKAGFEYSKKIFVGFGKAIQGDFLDWRCWIDTPHWLKFGGTGKTQHGGSSCPKCVYYKLNLEQEGWDYQFHLLDPAPPHATQTYEQGDDYWSMMHNLPWIGGPKDSRVADILDDPEDLDIFEELNL